MSTPCRTALNIRTGDSLSPAPPFPLGTFDAVLANPPYVNIRQLARQHPPEYIRDLRERFRTARGNFDLYVLFIERALQWLRPGGCCGLIVPNKWATLDYAQSCRELLQQEAVLDEVIDLSSHRVFREASVYPHVVILTKRTPSPGVHAGRGRESIAATRFPCGQSRPQLTPDPFFVGKSIEVESQVATQPLGSLVRLSCGTPGYAAAKVAAQLAEGDASPSPALPFITSGNIDRYAIRTGNVRYQGRLWHDPRLAVESTALTARQRQLFQSPKLVIAGLTRRLEAAWDDRGLALGVQVFAANEFQVDPFYLLALLNSKLLSYLFRTRFAAKRLGGDYLAVNKGQLAKLPIVIRATSESSDPAISNRLAELAKECSSGSQVVAADEEIDRLVNRLYRLTALQSRQVETHFADFPIRESAA